MGVVPLLLLLLMTLPFSVMAKDLGELSAGLGKWCQEPFVPRLR
jgi:hypothetical protein